MKKLFVVLLVAVLVPACLFAKLAVGAYAVPNGNSQQVIDAIKAEEWDWFDMSNYTFGVQTRANLIGLLEIDLSTGITEVGDSGDWLNDHAFPINLDAGLGFGTLIRIGLTAGLDAIYAPALGDDPFLFGYMNASKADVISEFSDLAQALGEGEITPMSMLMASPFRVRLTASVVLGPLMVGAEYSLYTPYCIATFTNKDAWKDAHMDRTIDFANSSLAIFAGIEF